MHDSSQPIPVLSLDGFARALSVNGAHVGWLLGAGTSAAAGVPTAGQLLDEFKAELYASACNVDRSQVAMADPLVAERVRRFFDGANGLPSAGSPEEYAVGFELTYPDAGVRRRCLDRWLSQGRPGFGHRVMAALMASGNLRWFATTNFDDLPERAYEQLRARDQTLHRLTVAAVDSADRAARALREDDLPLAIKLHGDIASDRLKNTPAELQDQDRTLRQAILDASRTYGLAVIGYSGRDASLMETLETAVQAPEAFPHGLFWLTHDPAAASARVHQLLDAARRAGVKAHFVEAANFDETFGAIGRHIVLPDHLAEWVRAARPAPRVTPVSLAETEAGLFPALRLNALPILDYPRAALRIRCRRPVPWKLRPLLRAVNMPGFGIASGREVLAFGVPDGWHRALTDFEPISVETVPIDPGAEGADSLVLALAYEGITRAIAHDRPLRPLLRRKGHSVVVVPSTDGASPPELSPIRDAYGEALSGTLAGGKRWSEGVRLRIDQRLGRLWLLYEPWTLVEDEVPPKTSPERPRRSKRSPPEASAVWAKERWATRRNEVWAAALAAWADVLVGGDTAELCSLGLGDPRAVDASFHVARQTAYSLPAHASTGTAA